MISGPKRSKLNHAHDDTSGKGNFSGTGSFTSDNNDNSDSGITGITIYRLCQIYCEDGVFVETKHYP